MKILNFGSCNIDYVYSVEKIVEPGETAASSKMEVFAGGKGLNQSLAIARSGQSVFHAGCIGQDGLFLKELLEKSNVDTRFLKIGERSGNAVIQVDKDGENCIILFKGANHEIKKDYVDFVLDNFEKGDWLILQNEISEIEYIIEKAFEKGLKIVLNPSPIDENILKLDLSKLSFLILNKIEAKNITNESEVDRICNFFSKKYPELNIVLTLGKDGSIFKNRDRTHFQNAFKTDAVDTTGAGDTFLGYFISQYIKTEDAPLALKTASMASKIAVSKKGAAASIPKIDEVTSELLKI